MSDEIVMTDALRQLMAMNAEVVPARFIAPVLKMSESVLIHRVKSGWWDEDAHGKVIVSGNRVKFFRKDFLIKHGFLQPEKPEKTTDQWLKDIYDLLDVLTKAVISMQDVHQRQTFLTLIEETEKKAASAATQAD